MNTRRRLVLLVTGLLSALSLVLAACTTSAAGGPGGGTGGGKAAQGGSAVFAESAGAPPNYIFPLDSLQYFNTSNINQFQFLMWRPLYWFGNGSSIRLNSSLSIANPPAYSRGNQAVTITLKHYAWSDGQPVTVRDVLFWINLLRANREDWGEYVPGYFPDDVSKVTTLGQYSLTLYLNAPVSPTWFTFNELSQLVPIPQHAWDKTSASGAVGNHDESTAGAHAVYKFLNAQSLDLGSYASNPLWQVVDGPWRLSQFSQNGYAVFVPNKKYSGPVKAHLAKFIEQPFQSESAEYNDLRSNALTYGYIPVTDIAQRSGIAATGYTVSPWYLWSMNIIPINFHNPADGPVFSQLYVRQAMQRLIDEPQYIKAILSGYGVPDYGPVPNGPKNQYISPQVAGGPLAYNAKAAGQLLAAHGWTMGSGGTRVCARPGTAADDCGRGIAKGTALSFSLVYASGSVAIDGEMRAFKSALSQAGITLSLSEAPAATVYGTAVPCSPGQSSCKWQMAYWGNGWEFSPDNYPSGEVAFSTGAVGNFGSYSDQQMDQLVKATTTTAGTSAFFRWEQYTAQQVPMLFMPLMPYQVSAISTRLRGAIPQPSDGLSLTPENWYFTR
ncbi:MAG TPA: ABC transporter substrate-binding protein [Streptosporangiaceae bacterium]